MNLGEFELIGKIREMFAPATPDGVSGIGDDCALLPQRSGMETLVSTDMLQEDVHFLRRDASPFNLGWKSAAVNLSDIAAMGGKPVATFLSIAIPKDLPTSWIIDFMDGYRELSLKYACPLLGGDTVSSPEKICINVTVLGSCKAGLSKMRSGAQAGDLICTTGPLGDSAAGLKILLAVPGKMRSEVESTLVERHYRPAPKIAAGQALASFESVHSLMDISDGIASDLPHILEASGLAARIDVNSIPLSKELEMVCKERNWDAATLAIEGGEDYELLFTADAASLSSIHSALIDCNSQLYVIGEVLPVDCAPRCVAGSIMWEGGKKSYNGFSHFKV